MLMTSYQLPHLLLHFLSYYTVEKESSLHALTCALMKKSCCLRIGLRFYLACALKTDKHEIAWVNEIRYLDTYIIAGR